MITSIYPHVKMALEKKLKYVTGGIITLYILLMTGKRQTLHPSSKKAKRTIRETAGQMVSLQPLGKSWRR